MELIKARNVAFALREAIHKQNSSGYSREEHVEALDALLRATDSAILQGPAKVDGGQMMPYGASWIMLSPDLEIVARKKQ